MAANKYVRCINLAAAVPRDVRQSLINQVKELEAGGMDPNKAAKQVATEMRDRARADQQSVMEGIKAAKAKPAAQPFVDRLRAITEGKSVELYHGSKKTGLTELTPNTSFTASRQLAEKFAGKSGEVYSREMVVPADNPLRWSAEGILKDIREGKITAEEAEKAFQARASEVKQAPATPPAPEAVVRNPPGWDVVPGERPPVSEQHQIAQQIANAHQQAMPHGPKVQVLTREQAAQATVNPERVTKIREGQINGFYDPRTDSVVIIPENVRPREGETVNGAIGRILTHESAGHGGWARLFRGGPLEPEFRGIMDAFWQQASGQDFGTAGKRKYGYSNLAELAQWYGYDAATPEGRAAVLQEHFARLAEDPTPPRWFDAAVAKLTELFRRLGFNAWTDSDTRLLLQKGRDALGTDRMSEAKQAESIQYSLAVGEIGKDPEKLPKFTANIQASNLWSEKMKEGMRYRQYNKVTEKGTQDQANNWINNVDFEQAIASVRTGEFPGLTTEKEEDRPLVKEEVGRQLIKRLDEQGRSLEAAEVADVMGAIATSHAQALRMFRPFADMSLGGLRAYTEKLTREGFGKNPIADELYRQVQRLKTEMAALKAKYAGRAVVRATTRGGKAGSVREKINTQLEKNQKSLAGTIKEVATDLNIKMRSVLMQDDVTKEQVKKQLTDEVVKRTGFSEEQAKEIADAVHAEFARQMKASQEAMIRQLLKAPTPRLSKTELEKLLEENNSGQLDDARLFSKLAKAHGVESWSPELSQKIKALQKKYQRFEAEEKTHGANGNTALEAGNIEEAKRHYKKAELAQDRKDYFGSQMFDAIHDTIPKGFAMHARTFQNLSMLLNGKTLIRNFLGNSVGFVFNVPADAVKMFILDPAWSIASGERTRRSLDIGVRVKGLAAPFLDYQQGYALKRAEGASVYTSAVAGLDMARKLGQISSASFLDKDVSRLTSNVYSSQIGKLFENGLSLSLSAADRAFWKAAYDGSIMRQRNLRRIDNRWATPQDPRFWEQPSSEEQEQALAEAGYAVYQNPNNISKLLTWIRAKINSWTGSKIFGVGSGEIPFGQVPGAMALRAAEWSPAGFLYGGYKFLTVPKEMRQNEVTNVLSRAIVGTAAPGLLGVWLAHLGIATALSDDDPDVREMQKDAGMGKYQINVTAWRRAVLSGNWWTPQEYQDGDLIRDYGWLQPLAFSFAMGVQAYNELVKPQKDKPDVAKYLGPAGQVTLAAVESFADLPMIQGIANTLKDVPDVWAGRKSIYQAGGEHFTNMAAQFVPTFLKQLNDYYDNQVKETRSQADWMGMLGINQVLAKVPGLSQRYPPKYNSFGDAIQRYEYGGNGFFNVFLNPFTTRQMKDSKGVRELNRLHSIMNANNVAPNAVERYIEVSDQGITMKVQLTNEQISEYQRISGELIRNAIGTRLASPEFAAATAGSQANQVVKDIEDINKHAKDLVILKFPAIGEQMRKQFKEESYRQGVLWWNTPGMRP